MRTKISVALCALSLVACRGAERYLDHNSHEVALPAEIKRPNNIADMNSNLVAASNAFGFDLFQQLLRQAANKNVFFSPLSVMVALGMTYNGAAGETKTGMERALKIEGMNLADLNRASSVLIEALKSSDPKIELAIANSLWTRGGMRFNEDFLERARRFYGAKISSLDFKNPESVATINNWVSGATKGKIGRIIDQINSEQVIFLINAVYFKGGWQKIFDKTLTKEQPFHLPDGHQRPAQMMAQSGDYLYLHGDKFQAVSLPYGNGSVTLYLFLPEQGSSVDEFLKGLSYQQWERWVNNFKKTRGDVKLPRFKLDYEKKLNDPLKELGMGVAFNPQKADFSGIHAEKGLYISEVKHKAIVEVNEEGTEAAAATSVGIAGTSASAPRERFTFIADRPFLMAIRDSQTGAILFMGAVMEPN
ncbi:MAG: serpin family protein [Chloracidobacterium sp.]|nr:serpin family protein [Chloracidobacterium sp.]